MDEQNLNETNSSESTPGQEAAIASLEAEIALGGSAPLESTPVTPSLAPKKKIIVGGVIAAALFAFAGGGYYFYTTHPSDGGPVAVVNGFKIARKEFNDSVTTITQTASLQGADVTDPNVQKAINDQALDTLVSNALLIEGAKAEGFSATPLDVQKEYDALVTQLGGEETLKTRMAEVGLTEEKLRSNINDRIMVDAFLKAKTDIGTATVTPEEVQSLYDSYKAGGTAVPPFEDVRAQLEAQILGQKQQEIVNKFIATLKEKATIEITI